MYTDFINNINEIRDKYRNLKYKHAEAIAKTIVTLPTNLLIKDRQRVKICETVRIGIKDADTCLTLSPPNKKVLDDSEGSMLEDQVWRGDSVRTISRKEEIS